MDCKSAFCCILTYAIVYVLIHHMLYLYILNSALYFYQVLLYLLFSIDVVFIVYMIVAFELTVGLFVLMHAIGNTFHKIALGLPEKKNGICLLVYNTSH